MKNRMVSALIVVSGSLITFAIANPQVRQACIDKFSAAKLTHSGTSSTDDEASEEDELTKKLPENKQLLVKSLGDAQAELAELERLQAVGLRRLHQMKVFLDELRDAALDECFPVTVFGIVYDKKGLEDQIRSSLDEYKNAQKNMLKLKDNRKDLLLEVTELAKEIQNSETNILTLPAKRILAKSGRVRKDSVELRKQMDRLNGESDNRSVLTFQEFLDVSSRTPSISSRDVETFIRNGF